MVQLLGPMQLGSSDGAGYPHWQIVQRAVDAGVVTKWDLYYGKRRVAWNLRDHDAAVRWMRRLQAQPATAPEFTTPPGQM
ncbi:MAG: hypothetical protein HY332_14130 [Chloroflexi bacterium]|nr:hypothetical protein [Chloroflexota bacterium]